MPNTTVTLVRLFFKTYLRCPPRIFYGTVPIGQTSTGFRIKALNAQDDDTGAAAQNRRLHFFLLVLSANGQETDYRITILEGISATDAWRLLNCWILLLLLLPTTVLSTRIRSRSHTDYVPRLWLLHTDDRTWVYWMGVPQTNRRRSLGLMNGTIISVRSTMGRLSWKMRRCFFTSITQA